MIQHKRLHPKYGGFTLIDYMVALGIIASILAVSVPYLKGGTTVLRLKREAEKFSGTLDRLILQAQQSETDIELTLSELSYQALRADGSILTQRALRIPLSFLFPVGQTQQTLYVSGAGTISPSTINLTDGQRTCTITTSLRGRVRQVCE